MSTIYMAVRPDDCDNFGHVNNAVYISYIQSIFAETISLYGFGEDWGRNGDFYWRLGTVACEYRQPVHYLDELETRLWLAEDHRTRPVFGIELLKDRGTGEKKVVAFRSRVSWSREARKTGEVFKLPALVFENLRNEAGSLPRPVKFPGDSREFKKYTRVLKVLPSGVGPAGRVHPRTIFQWFEDSVFDASEQAGWTLERMLESGFLTYQTRHDTEIISYPKLGDQLMVTSRVIEVRRLRGTWFLEIHQLPERILLARDYSTGVFLDLAGRPSTPAREMMNDLQFGKS